MELSDVRMVVVAPVYALLTSDTKVSGTPMCWRVVRIAEWGMLPKALRRSNQAMNRERLLTRASRTMDLRRKVCS